MVTPAEKEILVKLTDIGNQIDEYETTLESIKMKISILKKERTLLNMQYSVLGVKKNQIDDYLDTDYSWSEKVEYELKHTFKFDSFRPSQLGAINASLLNKDVLVVMPTGSGKSLIYQMNTIIREKLTVVISPILALIEDQMNSLAKFNITAASINSSMTRPEKTEVQNRLKNKEIQIIFVTPELMAKSTLFMNILHNLHKENYVGIFVIDEVHCCSEWGHDFRPDYQCLSLLRSQFHCVPILGLTATASLSVLVDLKSVLCLGDPVLILASLNRPNLFFEVVNRPEEAKEFIENLIKTKYMNMCGIIYVAAQKDTEELAHYLRDRNIKAAPFYAGLAPEIKKSIQKKWFRNHYNVLVATIAFGMGIDKSDVKFVIHYTVPKTIEALYQECGRAGRNGEEADCIVMFRVSEWLRTFARTKSQTEEKKSRSVLSYCLDLTTCRRTLLAKYFEDETTYECNNMCDHCKSDTNHLIKYDIQPCLQDIHAMLVYARESQLTVTIKKLILAWYTRSKKFKHKIPTFRKEQAEYIIGHLIDKSHIKVRTGHNLATSYALIYTDQNVVSEQPIPMLYNGTLAGLNVMSEDESAPSTSRQKRGNRQGKGASVAKKSRAK